MWGGFALSSVNGRCPRGPKGPAQNTDISHARLPLISAHHPDTYLGSDEQHEGVPDAGLDTDGVLTLQQRLARDVAPPHAPPVRGT